MYTGWSCILKYKNSKQSNSVIDKSQELQKRFENTINLSYLEKAKNLVNEAIEKSAADDSNRALYVSELNHLHEEFPKLKEWLSGSKCDYQLDIRYIYDADNLEYEELNRCVIITYRNDVNNNKKNMQNFFKQHKAVFDDQFLYAKVGFEGNSYEQSAYQTDHWQDWVSIFLSKLDYPKMMPNDESFEIVNAPPLDGSRKVYLPVQPDYLLDSELNLDSEIKSPGGGYRLLFYLDDEGEKPEKPVFFLVISDNLLDSIVDTGKLIASKQGIDLDVRSFHFLINKIYISEEMKTAMNNDEILFDEWFYKNCPEFSKNIIVEKRSTEINWSDYLCYEGDRNGELFAEIIITREGDCFTVEKDVEGPCVSLNLIYNNSSWEDVYEYDYWDGNPNEYPIILSHALDGFLAQFNQ